MSRFRVTAATMTIMRGDERPQSPLESDPGSPRRSTGDGKLREFLEGRRKFGGDWKRVLCAGMGSGNERKLQCGDFAKAAAAGDHFHRPGQRRPDGQAISGN